MANIHQTQIIKIGNSNGIRIPKEYLLSFSSKNVVIKLENNSLISTPINTVTPPRSKWGDILAKMKIEPEEDWNDFNTTLADGIEDI